MRTTHSVIILLRWEYKNCWLIQNEFAGYRSAILVDESHSVWPHLFPIMQVEHIYPAIYSTGGPGRICGCMEDDYCSREAAKHAKKTIDKTQTLYGNGNLPLNRQPAAAKFTAWLMGPE